MTTTLHQTGDQPGRELCMCVETSAPLTPEEMEKLHWLLAETFQPELTTTTSFLSGETIHVGPRLAVETADSSNAVAICQANGLGKITRVEMFRSYLVSGLGAKKPEELFDRMTECLYASVPNSFTSDIFPAPVTIVPVLEKGSEALREINRTLGLGMDDWDIEFYTRLFREVFGRNPTSVECFQLGQANSEHCRHWFFKGRIFINGIEMPYSLMEVVKEPLRRCGKNSNSVIAFADNSSAIKGYTIEALVSKGASGPASFFLKHCVRHIIFTAETHNHPSMVQPFRGAETGTGGRIRDIQATGRGGIMVAGTAGYAVGNLLIPGYQIPGEDSSFVYPKQYAKPLQILIGASNGASDYGNKIGEPLINGFVRSFGLLLPSGERREWIKPIMFTAGIGMMDADHATKKEAKKGMAIVQIGGPAYRIGVGGGAASSMTQGANTAELDFSSVQRGDAQMEQRVNRVVRACAESGYSNPILSIHDQGAGGPCNVVTELVHPAGGKVNIRAIKVGDISLSVLEIWGAEYQERLAILIDPGSLEHFQAICERERVPCEVLGEVTGDGNITVYDPKDGSTPVDLALEKILGSVPQKEFRFDRLQRKLKPLKIPRGETIASLLKKVLRLPSVGSKGFLVRKVDRSVTGLIAGQQCVGPFHLPVADYGLCAQSHFGLSGMATAIGEQPLKMLVNPAAGARMAVGEMLTNIVWVRSEGLSNIKSSGNWMWAAKLPGEGAEIYDAAIAARDLLIALGGAEIDGGKDSLSMAAKVGDETVKAPGQFVVSGYVAVPNITKKVTPDIKKAGESCLGLIDLSGGKRRLGGSALAQVCGQIGNESPDVEDSKILRAAFDAVQELVGEGLILSGHDRSDGGLITTVLEMAMSGNSGVEIYTDGNAIPDLFAEELGMVVEYCQKDTATINSVLKKYGISSLFRFLGYTKKERNFVVKQRRGGKEVFCENLKTLRNQWEATSDKLEQLQMNPECARKAVTERSLVVPCSKLSFTPIPTPEEWLRASTKPRVAIIREVGSNGDREMAAAFYAAGFEPWDVTMTDLLQGKIDLNDPHIGFRGIVFVGGFSHADVFGSAKGWAAIIRANVRVKEMFGTFYNRPDTFSLGVCNGCQLMALLGWVPGNTENERDQLRFVHNTSGRFESNWLSVRIEKSPAIMLEGMEGSILGVWVAHGEGRLYARKPGLIKDVAKKNLVPFAYATPVGLRAERYPANPNGSPGGWAGLCSADGRHLAMMPHPERAFLKWQWPWMSPEVEAAAASPWLRMFQNARSWCEGSSCGD